MRDTTFYYIRNIDSIPTSRNEEKSTTNFCTFKFITPYTPSNLRFDGDTTSRQQRQSRRRLHSKIYLRASALIYHYFEHIRFLFKSRPDENNFKTNRVMCCYIKRECSHVITLTKAPMAHKKFSREQYYFKYYTFIFQYPNVLNFETKVISHETVTFVNSSLNRLLRAMGTNLFFLRTCRVFYCFSSSILI